MSINTNICDRLDIMIGIFLDSNIQYVSFSAFNSIENINTTSIHDLEVVLSACDYLGSWRDSLLTRIDSFLIRRVNESTAPFIKADLPPPFH